MSADSVVERIDNLRLAWRSMDAGRRNLVVFCSVGLGVLLALGLAVAQARESTRLNGVLQQLAHQEAQFYADASEAKALLQTPESSKGLEEATVAAVQALAGEGVSVTPSGAGGFRLMSASMRYTQWWALCGELDRRFGLTLSALELAPKQDVKENISFDMTVAKGRAP